MPDEPRLPPLAAEPPKEPDAATELERTRAAAEVANLTPTGRDALRHQEVVAQMKAHIAYLTTAIEQVQAEKNQVNRHNDALHAVEIEHAKLATSNRYGQLLLILGAVAVAIGGTLAGSQEGAWKGVGWGVLVSGATVQFLVAIFDPLR